MKITRWKPVLYRRNAREEEFLQIPRGFWAPLAQLLQTPHLTGAAVALLQAELPRCFAVRGTAWATPRMPPPGCCPWCSTGKRWTCPR